ncbi:MAG: glycosyltransferase family 4 protein [Vicinamibacteria bacterium]
MRIAQVAPLYESVPPQYYGGTERVVSYLTEELVRQGHEVTLFASGDSVTSSRLRATCRRSLRLDESCIDQLAHHVLMLERVFQAAEEYDIVHFHTDYLAYPMLRRQPIQSLTTLHGRLDIPDLVPLYREFREIPVVSISDAQREPLGWIHWLDTVYHGLPADLYRFREEPGKYLAFLGRISPEKRVDRAIRIARHVGIPLRIAAKVDDVDREYFENVISPLIRDSPEVEYVGEVGEGEKNEFLGNAHALLFPIDWPEPFGMVMIESMACGTPVIAYERGSVPEVLEQGVTGFIVRDLRTAIRAVERVKELSRRRIRDAFEARFTAERMTRDYLRIYRSVLRPAMQETAVGIEAVPEE